MELENGKRYLVNHSRKGTFMFLVESQCDEWVNGLVVGGEASAIMDYNVKQAGEQLTSRKSFIRSAIEQP